MDKFDEMARHLNDHAPYCVCDPCMAIGRALRETDAKAREGCARIAEKAYRGPGDVPALVEDMDAYGGFCFAMKRIAREIRSSRTAIREGADACGGMPDPDTFLIPTRCEACFAGTGACAACEGADACGTLRTWSADGRECGPTTPEFEAACKRGDVVEREAYCLRCEDRGVVVDDPTYISGLSPLNDLPQHNPYPCPACQGGDDA